MISANKEHSLDEIDDAGRSYRMITANKEHALGEIDDDGNRDRCFRRYRYVCRCGRAGDWVDGIGQARAHHAVHRSDEAEEAAALDRALAAQWAARQPAVVLSMCSRVPITKGQTAQITSDAKKHAWIVERLLISGSGTPRGARDWWIRSIRVNGREKLKKSIFGDVFAINEVWSDVRWKIPAGRKIVMVVDYVGKKRLGCPFIAAIVGQRDRTPRTRRAR